MGMSSRPGRWSDQCLLNGLLIHNDSFLKHARALEYKKDEIRLLQCRRRCKEMRCEPSCTDPMCCRPSDWLVHWPAHNWWQLLHRVWEQQTLELMPGAFDVGPWPTNDFQVVWLSAWILVFCSCPVVVLVHGGRIAWR